MGLINRFLLCLYTLSFAVLALGVAALVLQLVPERYIWNEFQFLEAQWQTGAVAFVVFLLSIHLLAVSLTGAGKKAAFDKEVILVHGGSGDVRVAVAAVQSLVDKVARTVTGVRDVKVRVTAEKRPEKDAFVRATLRVTAGQEKNVAAVSDEIRSRVQQQLADVVGIADFAVDIDIVDITNAAMTKKQRVV